MKKLIQLEELLMLGLAIYLNMLLPYSWWMYWALFLAPDIGMIGYLFNTKIGAVTYNITHHKAIAIGLYLVGVYLNLDIVKFIGLLLFGHSSFDRIMGYGLKHFDNFKHTHLGWLNGKNELTN